MSQASTAVTAIRIHEPDSAPTESLTPSTPLIPDDIFPQTNDPLFAIAALLIIVCICALIVISIAYYRLSKAHNSNPPRYHPTGSTAHIRKQHFRRIDGPHPLVYALGFVLIIGIVITVIYFTLN